MWGRERKKKNQQQTNSSEQSKDPWATALLLIAYLFNVQGNFCCFLKKNEISRWDHQSTIKGGNEQYLRRAKISSHYGKDADYKLQAADGKIKQ